MARRRNSKFTDKQRKFLYANGIISKSGRVTNKRAYRAYNKGRLAMIADSKSEKAFRKRNRHSGRYQALGAVVGGLAGYGLGRRFGVGRAGAGIGLIAGTHGGATVHKRVVKRRPMPKLRGRLIDLGEPGKQQIKYVSRKRKLWIGDR